MRLTFYLLAEISNESESGKRALLTLNQSEVTEERLADYLDSELADLGVTGGVIRCWIEDDRSGFEVTYTVPENFSDEMVEKLKEFTVAQLDDGVGEDGFELDLDGKQIYLKADTDALIQYELIDDRKKVRRASRIAIAAREGEISTLSELLKSCTQEINNLHQGFSALHLAILYGHYEAITLLISYGADLNQFDVDDTTPLELCALSNSLDDDQSYEIVKLLLKKGANPQHVCSDGETAETYALCRNKTKTAKLLSDKN
ncbi:ankyrin repeat domain-containing protein [Gimesia sp.]|uniref:ankyrin repeat domain-containing protein n=1 Tax=Gimesia sp. TaxID=2024833 RepID=UPI000C3EAAB4|nr:ankyrin repeat domain-containing protein [Gimesia sp.]MAX36997.1 hypothetical protein [Gimesia sp.]HAH47086.1 hypothetical protein [Planctomycetaceae bacterium]HBL48148.1 hypothetical protein [Planctomycetaceae bacterium]|tara:strand:+ start:10350 stop:11129 length:780 start_codon:yes stop_codon:yes gene_type:complete